MSANESRTDIVQDNIFRYIDDLKAKKTIRESTYCVTGLSRQEKKNNKRWAVAVLLAFILGLGYLSNSRADFFKTQHACVMPADANKCRKGDTLLVPTSYAGQMCDMSKPLTYAGVIIGRHPFILCTYSGVRLKRP